MNITVKSKTIKKDWSKALEQLPQEINESDKEIVYTYARVNAAKFRDTGATLRSIKLKTLSPSKATITADDPAAFFVEYVYKYPFLRDAVRNSKKFRRVEYKKITKEIMQGKR
jgi:hypothetical protein